MAYSTSTQYPPGYLEEDLSSLVLGVASTFLVIDTVSLILLLTARYLAKGERSNIAMEMFMTSAYLVCVGKITVIILMVKIGGTGRHSVTIPANTRATALKLSVASQIICPFTTSLSKLGILAFLQCILRHSGKWYLHAIRLTFALVTITLLVQVLVPFLNCRPFKKMWLPQSEGTCSIPSLALWRYLGIPNFITTFMVIGIPVPALAKLHVSRAVKAGLGIVFIVCLLGIVASIMRTYSFLKIEDFKDITYENVRPYCWIMAESGIYLVAGTMLTLRPLLRKFFGGTRLERLVNSYTHGDRRGSWEYGKRSWKFWERRSVAVVIDEKANSEKRISDIEGDELKKKDSKVSTDFSTTEWR